MPPCLTSLRGGNPSRAQFARHPSTLRYLTSFHIAQAYQTLELTTIGRGVAVSSLRPTDIRSRGRIAYTPSDRHRTQPLVPRVPCLLGDRQTRSSDHKNSITTTFGCLTIRKQIYRRHPIK